MVLVFDGLLSFGIYYLCFCLGVAWFWRGFTGLGLLLFANVFVLELVCVYFRLFFACFDLFCVSDLCGGFDCGWVLQLVCLWFWFVVLWLGRGVLRFWGFHTEIPVQRLVMCANVLLGEFLRGWCDILDLVVFLLADSVFVLFRIILFLFVVNVCLGFLGFTFLFF